MHSFKPGVLAAAVAVAVTIGLGASPSSAAVTSGRERIDLPDPYPVKLRAPGVPSPDQGVIRGSGFTPGQPVYVQVCDGVKPSTSQGYTTADHCAYANSASIADATGNVIIDTAQLSFQFEGPFHGEDPEDDFFNCLAPDDDPDGPATVVGDQPINPDLPSWGSARGASTEGGGSAPCQLRFSENPSEYQPSDVYIPMTGLGATGAAGGSSFPTAAVAVPAAVLIAGGGVVLWRRRRRVSVGTAAGRAPHHPRTSATEREPRHSATGRERDISATGRKMRQGATP